MTCRAMYKSELAQAAGVSLDTFRRWLKSDSEQLREWHISPHAKLLPPHVVKYLCEKYVIDIYRR